MQLLKILTMIFALGPCVYGGGKSAESSASTDVTDEQKNVARSDDMKAIFSLLDCIDKQNDKIKTTRI